MSLKCDSDLWCKVGRLGALPLGEKPLSFSPLGLFTCECVLLCSLSPVLWILSVLLTLLSVSPEVLVCQQLALVPLRYCLHLVTGTGPL